MPYDIGDTGDLTFCFGGRQDVGTVVARPFRRANEIRAQPIRTTFQPCSTGIMQQSKEVSRDGGAAKEAGAPGSSTTTERLTANVVDTQTTADHIEILLESEGRSSSLQQEMEVSFGGSLSDSRLDGSSGVEVVTVSVAPLLSYDTNVTLSKTFGDESVIAGACQALKQGEDASGCNEADKSLTVGREEIETALEAGAQPLYKKLLGYVPITPRGFRQQELKVIIEGAHAREGSPLETNRSFADDESTIARASEERGSHSTSEDSFGEEICSKDSTTAKQESRTLQMQGEDGISPRFIGRKMNSSRPPPLSTEIDSVPTYDTRVGIIKEQFEATIDSTALKKGKNWKSVVFGLGQSTPHNTIKGNLKSILRLPFTDTQATSSSASEDSNRQEPRNQLKDEGIPTAPFTEGQVESTQNEPPSLFRRRVPSFTRPYADRESALEGVELVKQSFGSRQPSFLRSITFDDEPAGQRRSSDLISSWMALRRSRSEGVSRKLKSEDYEPNENRSEVFLKNQGPPEAESRLQTGLTAAGAPLVYMDSKASVSSSNDASMIVKEYFLPLDHGGAKRSNPSSVASPKQVLGESTAANTEELRVVPCPVVQSSPTKSADKIRRKPSTTAKVDSISTETRNHQYYHHVSPRSEKKGKGTRNLKMAAEVEALTEMEQKFQEVAKARMRPNQSLQDAVEELEVELLEARKGKSREIRDMMFQRIRNQTQRRITERGDPPKTIQTGHR